MKIPKIPKKLVQILGTNAELRSRIVYLTNERAAALASMRLSQSAYERKEEEKTMYRRRSEALAAELAGQGDLIANLQGLVREQAKLLTACSEPRYGEVEELRDELRRAGGAHQQAEAAMLGTITELNVRLGSMMALAHAVLDVGGGKILRALGVTDAADDAESDGVLGVRFGVPRGGGSVPDRGDGAGDGRDADLSQERGAVAGDAADEGADEALG